MRVTPIFATGVLLLVSINVAEAADPTLLAETGAYLLGNAYRCGMPDDRIEHAGTVIRDLIVPDGGGIIAQSVRHTVSRPTCHRPCRPFACRSSQKDERGGCRSTACNGWR